MKIEPLKGNKMENEYDKAVRFFTEYGTMLKQFHGMDVIGYETQEEDGREFLVSWYNDKTKVMKNIVVTDNVHGFEITTSAIDNLSVVWSKTFKSFNEFEIEA